MSDGLFVHKTDDEYVVMNEMGFILKSAKTLKTCDIYVQKQLESRRAAERYANENNRDFGNRSF